jgi:4-aminobutyrate aminotransferase-like enzyme
VGAPSDSSATPVADNVQAAVDRLAQRGLSPAALFLECGFLSDGVIRPGNADLGLAVEVARAAGALVVADEVQMGHGRSGQGLWCFEAFGITPDLVTLGKPMGNGYPVAAVITRREIPAQLGRQTYWFSTFGGNPVASRAAAAVLEVIEDEGLIVQAGEVGASIRRGIEELRPHHPSIQAVRGQGLLAGAELADPSAEARDGALLAAEVTDELRRLGVLVGRTGPRNNVVKIRPPLVFDREHVGILLEAFDSALSRVEDI